MWAVRALGMVRCGCWGVDGGKGTAVGGEGGERGGGGPCQSSPCPVTNAWCTYLAQGSSVWTPETLRASQSERDTSVPCCLYSMRTVTPSLTSQRGSSKARELWNYVGNAKLWRRPSPHRQTWDVGNGSCNERQKEGVHCREWNCHD